MKTLAATLLSGCLALTAAGAIAADDMKKTDPMKKEMTMQECKDHMAMAKKDDAMMKKDAMCADMMKKDAAMKKDDAAMKKDDGMTKKEEPMKK
jgi:hypothetical protein